LEIATCSFGDLKGQKRQIFDLRFSLSEVPTWAPDSHPKTFSSIASTSWSYLNLKFDSPLHHAAERFDSLLYHAAERFDSPLHHAAGSQTSIVIKIREFETKFEKT
jgi:hypothetical protein